MKTGDGKELYVGMRVSATQDFMDIMRQSVGAFTRGVSSQSLVDKMKSSVATPLTGVVTQVLPSGAAVVKSDNASIVPMQVPADQLLDARSVVGKVPWWAWLAGGLVAYKLTSGALKLAGVGLAGYGAYRIYKERTTAK
jgi:hypothetical protein